MADSILNQPHFQDADKARQHLEAIRWPNGPICPHCGSVSKAHYALQGKAHRPGLWKCKDCRKQFSVTVGTVFERSKVPLHQWMQAVYLICSSKKGCSSHQLQRTLNVQYKTAWFMNHRLREAMKSPRGIMGGGGGTIEADETFIGRKPGSRKGRGGARTHLILPLMLPVPGAAAAAVPPADANKAEEFGGGKGGSGGNPPPNPPNNSQPEGLGDAKAKYLAALIKLFEDRSAKGDLDEKLMERIERLIGAPAA